MQRFWNDERLQALRKLAEASTVYRANKTPMPRKDWDAGLKKLETQDFAAYKLMKKIPLKSIKWMWSKHQNVTYGFCSTATCSNKIDPSQLYCVKCRPNQLGYHRGVYSNPSLKVNMDLVTKAIDNRSVKELRTAIISSIERLPFSMKRSILGEEFRDMIEEKELKKKKA